MSGAGSNLVKAVGPVFKQKLSKRVKKRVLAILAIFLVLWSLRPGTPFKKVSPNEKFVARVEYPRLFWLIAAGNAPWGKKLLFTKVTVSENSWFGKTQTVYHEKTSLVEDDPVPEGLLWNPDSRSLVFVYHYKVGYGGEVYRINDKPFFAERVMIKNY